MKQLERTMFQKGLAAGISESFSFQTQSTQEKILETIERNVDRIDKGFMGSLASKIKFTYIKDKKIQERILDLAEKRNDFAEDFGRSDITKNFSSIKDKEIKERILKLTEKDKITIITCLIKSDELCCSFYPVRRSS
jgi:hypothetical protein